MHKHTALSTLFPFGRSTLHHYPEPAGDGTGEGQAQGGTPPANGASNGAPPPAGEANGGAPPAKGEGSGNPNSNPGQFKPEWLNDRIAQAKRAERDAVLKELGITDPNAAKQLLEAGQKAIDATKSELQRKDEENQALRTVADQAKVYGDALTKRATAELNKLPEEARERVKAIAGDDPVKLLETIDLALTMGTKAGADSGNAGGQSGQGQPAGQGAPQQGQKQPVPPAANTTGAAGGPPSASGSETDHLAVWRDMQSKNPFAAAQYFLAHQTAIVEQQQKQNQ